jgi:two-component system, sensor histidine kinase and response regulator
MTNPAITSNVIRFQPFVSGVQSRKMSRPATEDGFRDLLESVWINTSEAMRVTDSEGTITAVNDAYCRLVGMNADELIGKPFSIVYGGSVDPSVVLDKYRVRFKESAIQSEMSRKVRLRDGRDIYAETTNSFVHGSNGETFVLSIIRDVTERKRVEGDLKESERRYHEFFNNAMEPIFQSSVDGRLLTANASLIKMLGYDSFEELASRNLAELYSNPSDRDALSKDLLEKGSCSDVELTLKRKDGTVMTVLEHSRAVKDGNGDIVMFEGMLEDITERKFADEARRQAQDELQRERNQLRILIDNLPDLIYFKDAEGHYVLNNRAHLQSLGVEQQADVLGKTTFDFNPPEFAKEYHADHMQIVNSRIPLIEKEEPALHKNTGEQRWHLTSKIPLLDSQGTVTGVVGISRDITERKDLQARVQDSLSALQASRESLSQLNNQKDRLFSVLSHDLRSPFTSILGFCEILITDGESLTDTERKEFLTYIRDAAQRQLALLNRLLDWSRLETGRIKLDIQEIGLDELVKSCLTTHLGISKQKEITLRSTIPANSKVRGDQVLLMQAFNNLLSNSLKFTPKGGVISIDLVEEKEEEWIVAVKDTGRGIPKDDLKRLFKVEEKYTRPGLNGEQGTGLGLSLVYEILKQHNGSISVDSELGQGTTFTIRLPRVAENKEHVILVVDDDEGVRVLHSRFLKKIYADAHVIQASNGKEAFALAKQYKPRIIVTDYSMPEMNGYEFLNLLKGESSTKHIPVFVITGKGSTASSDTLMMSGAAAVMDKPVPSKTLQETIEKVMTEKI